LPDHSFLHQAKAKLKLPRDIEALQSIEEAIGYFENTKPEVLKNEFNHPINWDLVKTIPEGQLAIIKTTRGNITIRLLVNEAPGSVANFISLAQAKYFDNKFIHRVDPNFVIQTGCARGDGWGSEDYSIRSEFSQRRYSTGSVGMASAGKDTEGTQWFITHSPTPHLDGRYTLFAEVEDGMAVVDYLQVGDQILEVVLKNPDTP
jgi:cyclophilin family peptidyl-prolyl cis-trans isomerase